MAEAINTPAGASESRGAVLKMKDLEALTGVSREAIHFYLREGLLPEPERPKRNVAYYSDEHVVRIQAIKRLQQERSLPLEAIKPLLDNFDYEALQTQDDLGRFELTVQSHVNGELPAHNQRVADISAETGLSKAFFDELDAQGIIRLQSTGGATEIDFPDAAIVRLWAKLQKLGFNEAKGYDAGYLKRFADAMAPITEAEVDNFLRQFGDVPTDDAAQMASEGIAITNEILTRLRTQAIMRALHQRAKSADQDA
jgi:DNA-binding transcriptional MerR regulator